MADPHPSEAVDLEALAGSVSQPAALQCCCGNTDCDFLRQNCSVLDSVEKDVHTAARLGQVRSRRTMTLDEIWGCTLPQACLHVYSTRDPILLVAQGPVLGPRHGRSNAGSHSFYRALPDISFRPCLVRTRGFKTVAFQILPCQITLSMPSMSCALAPCLAGMPQGCSRDPFFATQDALPSPAPSTCGLPGLTFALQALLARHEALMVSAETERFHMQERIDRLEMDKKSLEAENARTIQENRALLDQLESLNNSVADSETHIKSLEASLQSTQQTIRKLEVAESRATELESQVHVLETEQAELQNTLVMTQTEARSAMQRWRKAERGITDIQEKLERIEREAREERDRHTEMVDRMQHQRAVEKDLNTAAGRLKGAAAAKTITDGKNGGVVSHFVRDLLSDNANLQLGIAELREMLMNSNDEIQNLREQLMFHQPADNGETSEASTLRFELGREVSGPNTPRSPRPTYKAEPTTSVSQELHIHHHYHAAKPAEPKRPVKKKRQVLNSNIYQAPKPLSPAGPSSPVPWRLEHRAASPGLAAHSVKDSISTVPSTRWSVFSDQPSDFAPSSVPSSPMSHHRRISVFDPPDDYELPSPTTSVDPASPAWKKKHRSQNSDAAMRKFATPRPLYLDDVAEGGSHDRPVSPKSQRTPRFSENRRPAHATPEITVATSSDVSTDVSSGGLFRKHFSPAFDDIDVFTGSPRPRMRRAASSESIMSLSGGLDIHTLQGRPSQLALRPLGAASANTMVQAVIARPVIARGCTDGKRGSIVIRDNLLSLPNIRAASAGAPSAARAELAAAQQRQTSASSLGKIVKKWRPWGSKDPSPTTNVEQTDSGATTPCPSERTEGTEGASPDSTTPATGSPGSSIMEITQSGSNETPTRDAKKPPPPPPKEFAFSPRSTGINQAGAIPGFSAYWAAHQQKGPPTQIVPRMVDTEALREGLEELISP